MAVVEVLMPKMGESITDATIIKWHKKEGEKISEEDTLLEVATDKVDSEIPSPNSGILKEILYPEDSVVDVGAVIAIIETDSSQGPTKEIKEKKINPDTEIKPTVEAVTVVESNVQRKVKKPSPQRSSVISEDEKFYSPLVRNIAKKEGITQQQLDTIVGSGANGRVTKSDILSFIENGGPSSVSNVPVNPNFSQSATSQEKSVKSEAPASSKSGGDEIVAMDRMRKLIADHMIHSKNTAAHVTSFAEADVTNMAIWRQGAKVPFLNKYGTKLTFTPLIVEVVAKALREHPRLNASLDGENIIIKKDVNIGMATALPSGNLIVPVLHHADQLNLNGLASKVNDIVERARGNNLKPSEIQNGTFTLTNIGTFNSLMGTPIINQPQLAILATGAIKKKPVVIETPEGDAIAIRHMMYLSLSYDHRVIDGYLGGTFLQTVVRLLENFDDQREI